MGGNKRDKGGTTGRRWTKEDKSKVPSGEGTGDRRGFNFDDVTGPTPPPIPTSVTGGLYRSYPFVSRRRSYYEIFLPVKVFGKCRGLDPRKP